MRKVKKGETTIVGSRVGLLSKLTNENKLQERTIYFSSHTLFQFLQSLLTVLSA